MNQERSLNQAVISGPTGAVGNALVRKLLARGCEVYAVTRPGSARTDTLPKNDLLHLIPCDLSNYRNLPDLIPNADAFFHLGWGSTFGPGRNDMPAQTENIRAALDAIDAAERLGCSVFLFAGSQAEYGRFSGALRGDTPCFPENGYGIAKLCAGQMGKIECRKRGIAFIHLRILSVYGPFDRESSLIQSVIRALLRHEKPALTAGEQIWDFLYSEDAAEALIRCAAAGEDGKCYPLGSGQAVPLRQFIETLRDQINPELPLGFGEIPYSPQQVMHLQADISELTKDTGFLPSVSFQEGIRKTIQWVKGEE